MYGTIGLVLLGLVNGQGYAELWNSDSKCAGKPVRIDKPCSPFTVGTWTAFKTWKCYNGKGVMCQFNYLKDCEDNIKVFGCGMISVQPLDDKECNYAFTQGAQVFGKGYCPIESVTTKGDVVSTNKPSTKTDLVVATSTKQSAVTTDAVTTDAASVGQVSGATTLSNSATVPAAATTTTTSGAVETRYTNGILVLCMVLYSLL
ncbi:hypothetical protein BC833DRAFT_617641 [Globomyces pollinis-pini]|nr:hypothetical protein BC833DRAFT_617641 [Globomyces pollinis-pini]